MSRDASEVCGVFSLGSGQLQWWDFSVPWTGQNRHKAFWKCIFKKTLGGGFKCFLFSPLPGKMIRFDSYFSNGLKPRTRNMALVHCQISFLWSKYLYKPMETILRILTPPLKHLGPQNTWILIPHDISMILRASEHSPNITTLLKRIRFFNCEGFEAVIF